MRRRGVESESPLTRHPILNRAAPRRAAGQSQLQVFSRSSLPNLFIVLPATRPGPAARRGPGFNRRPCARGSGGLGPRLGLGGHARRRDAGDRAIVRRPGPRQVSWAGGDMTGARPHEGEKEGGPFRGRRSTSKHK